MAKIRINGDTSGYIEISAPAVAGSTSITLPATTGGSLLATDASGNLNVDSGLLYVDGVNNRVGIGTTSVGYTLEVRPSSNDGNFFVGNASGPGILAGYSTGGVAGYLQAYNTTSSAFINLNVNGSTVRFGTGSAATERVRIDSSGNFLFNNATSVFAGQYEGGSVDPSTANYFVGMECRLGGDRNLVLTAKTGDAGGNILFKTGYTTTGSVSERARINNTGNLLVGTTSVGTGAGQGTGTIVQANGSFYAYEGTNTGGHGGAIAFGTNSNATYTPMAQIKGSLTNAPGTEQQGDLLFFTRPTGSAGQVLTERMRIANNGIFTYFNDGVYNFRTAQAASGVAAGIDLTHSSTGMFNGTLSFRVWTNGNVVNTNGSYTAISDSKLKENIVDANSQWDDLKAIKIRNWNFKEETGHETHRQIGPIAQELEEVCPGLVFDSPDRDENGNDLGTVTKGVNQSVLYMKAVKALQEAQLRIEQLEATNASFEARLSALEVKP